MTEGPQTPFADQLHREKYRQKDESFRDAMTRVASELSDDKEHFFKIRDMMLEQRFLAAGRVQSGIGSPKRVASHNCFVSGHIDDSFIDGHASIMARATEAAETMRKGGGIGYDFSTLRPNGAVIKKLGSTSSGPIPFMEIFDAICRCVSSSGHRRGAQMGILRVDHPDIEAFIRSKQPPAEATPVLREMDKHEQGSAEWLEWNTALQKMLKLTGFNISIAVTDEFMEAVIDGDPFTLRFGDKEYQEIDARSLFLLMMRSTWDCAEPGILFIDRINEMNNLNYCETICATNPCGEQPLPPYGACLLGSFNLVKYLKCTYCGDVKSDGTDRRTYVFDYETFKRDIPIVVRAMDNVIDQAIYPLREQEEESNSKRRMGLGVTGVANTIEALGHPYGSTEFVNVLSEILQSLTFGCYRASIDLAKEKGSFPLFDAVKYCKSKFIQKLPQDIQDGIREHGIRNSHLTSIAPTGTISMCADNVSSGIEPVFSYSQKRLVNMPGGQVEINVMDYGFGTLNIRGKKAAEVTAEEHLQVLATANNWVDSSVSKTCNVSSEMPWEDFKELFIEAWQLGCKGLTTYTSGGKRIGILSDADAEMKENLTCELDPETGRRNCE